MPNHYSNPKQIKNMRAETSFTLEFFETNALINIRTVFHEPLPRVQWESVSTTFCDFEVCCGPSTSKISAIFSDMSVSVSSSKSTENSGPGGFPSIVRVPQFLPIRGLEFGPIMIGSGRVRFLTGQKVLKFYKRLKMYNSELVTVKFIFLLFFNF